MKKIIYTLPNDTVQTVCPSKWFLERFPTEKEGLQAVIEKDVPAGARDILVVEDEQIPKDGHYRFAWRRPDGGLPVIDMDKAREIHAAMIYGARQKRNRALVEQEQLGEDVSVERTALQSMDMSAEIRNATTLEELKAVWPSGLPR